VLPSLAAAEVILRSHDPDAERPVAAADSPAPLVGKVDQPAAILLLPSYTVDTTSPFGDTTLYAIHNITAMALDLQITYRSSDGTPLRTDTVEVGARDTLSVNIRDVAGLPVDLDGFTRGYVVFEVVAPAGAMVVGDFIQVDVGDNFATGDRLVALADLCDAAEVRNFDVGEGTALTIIVFLARGTDLDTDPPTFSVVPLSEDGAIGPQIDVYTDDFLVQLTAADLSPFGAGNLTFDFTNASGGFVSAVYSAEGRFSVGINGACLAP
jgi:hypothetical protein